VNSRSRNFNQERLRKTIAEIDARVNEYLGRLDQEDATEGAASSPSAEELRKKIERLRERHEEASILLGYMEEQQIAEVSLTDPDSRRMKTGGVTDVCYNAQVAVDEKHHLIVSEDVTNDATDREWLVPMATASKRILERDELVVAADQGYSSNDQVKECVDRNIIPYIPKPSTSANKKLGLFTKDDFRYDSENDLYVCPAGEKLTYRFQTVEKGRPIRYYTTSACKSCELRTRCTRNKRTRRITRHADEAVLEKMYERVAAQPGIYIRRKSIVEHVFGTMKRWMDQGFFLMKGLAKVRTEFSLTAFAYNLRRVLNLLSVGEMIAALR
jgi:hypothetical protein